jgi:hypothetical protein
MNSINKFQDEIPEEVDEAFEIFEKINEINEGYKKFDKEIPKNLVSIKVGKILIEGSPEQIKNYQGK